MRQSVRFRRAGDVRFLFVVAATALVAARPVLAQEDVAKTSQNPIGNVYSFAFQDNIDFKVGSNEATNNTLNIQPVLPVTVGNVNWINRTIIPVKTQGEVTAGLETVTGLGDITYQGIFSPAAPGKVIWGVGAALIFPTATDDRLGAGKWQTGPVAIVLTMPGHWVIGALAQNTWSFAGDDARADVNFFFSQYFVNYNIKNGWYLTSSPIITSNWEAASGEQWTLPLGGGFGKIQRIGSTPVDFQIQAFYNAVKPDLAPDWQLRLQIKPILVK